MKTPEIQQELGAVILDAFPHIGVDVHEPGKSPCALRSATTEPTSAH